MDITIYDTLSAMRSIIAAPVPERRALYRELLIEPLRDHWSTIISRFAPQMVNDETMAMKVLWDVDLDADLSEYGQALDRLELFDAWKKADAALHLAARTFEATGRSCSEEHITGILVLGNPHERVFMELNRGYAGGQTPGYVILPIWPTDYNLPRIPSALVHEFNHRVRLTHEPWTAETTVGQYIVLEGLAESFATELYGYEYAGPWVTSLNAEEVARSKTIIGQALDVSGFDKLRAYIFGDELLKQWGAPGLGLPHAAGYTIGYQIVQACMQRSGKTATEATFVPYKEIIEESKFFA
ncbi:hypothetical protein KDA_69390 [Dictyobacter alpinus]|uniref:DUF2268 domain-containing protein n=1 Tax=Dictyobacter alpinus TaxID=2014873 RepID=A0A402BJD4_9CHLR|nr:DUF2268 domain-containing putative Zn-dependent protease [Dictyobacter alpinus]GCE31455.1 hypothetical protein KDA_69390 [Dictyobacter alpinus]